ncbi:MAG: hypothetical protein KJZ80_03455 [Hyphomicrobiaceae bacterium]|nr:hypothetical protein [Hyphomicrobiaceae bacterium]
MKNERAAFLAAAPCPYRRVRPCPDSIRLKPQDVSVEVKPKRSIARALRN